MSPIPRHRTHAGPAILSAGFRPFFLMGSLQAGLAVLLWLPFFFGEIALPTGFAPRDWHVHEMLFGFVPAVVTGFLLTAIPNWTGRLPLQGTSLLVLVAAWVAGRFAVAFSGVIGLVPAAVIDAAFLVLVLAATTREVAAGRNWRNLRVLVLVALLLAGNVAFHVEAIRTGTAEVAPRIGLAAVVMLLTLIGGRIVPSFTRNWLARENPGRLPAAFGRFDMAVVLVTALALVAWTWLPEGPATAALMALACAAQLVRLARWAGDRTWRDRLVLVLHAAYAFVPLGFGLLAAHAAALLPLSAGLHAWAVGGAGLMTLAVMSRASLGHTGRALRAGAPLQVAYVLVVLAALARICAALRPEAMVLLLHVAAVAWALGFLGFAVGSWAILTGPRLSGPAS